MSFKFTKSNLNFDVYTVASKPTAPGANNDIAIITSVPMPNWIMSPDKPSGRPRSDGDVWIRYSVSGNTFNALKNNSMMIAMIDAWQYVDGAWVDVEAVTCQNGEWVEWIPSGALYWEGNEFTSITGGFVAVAKKYQSSSSTSAKQPTLTRYDDYVYMEQSGVGAGVVYLINKVDLTGYSKLVAEGEFYSIGINSGNWTLSVWEELGTYYTGETAYVGTPIKEKQTILEVDISDLNGMYTVGFVMNTNGAGSSEVGYNKLVRLYRK